MTYYGAKELAAAFRTVRKNTIQIAEEIPEDKYGFRPAPGSRSVAETLVHIALSPRMQKQIQFTDRATTLAGFNFLGLRDQLEGEAGRPRTKAEIIALLRSEGEDFATLLEGASEAFLGESVESPQGVTPPARSRFEMLSGTKEHEMHHRGQLMLVERILGITPHLTRQMQERIAAMQAAAAAKQ